jgi:phosphonate transport system substrate-binding protein
MNMRQRTVGFISTVLAIVIIFMSLPVKANAQNPLILGIHPFLSSTELYRRFSPLADYLSRELGRPVQIHIESSYESHINSIGKGKIDIAFMGPASFVSLTRRFGRVPLLAVFETNGSRTFRGVIVVRKDSQIKTLSQLRGKKFAFGDVNSTMSHLVPRYMLLKSGLDVKHLGKADFLTNHDNIALGVLSGNFDAGALKEDIYDKYAQQGLRTLAISDPMPDHIFVARAGLPDDTVRKVSEILLSLKDTEEGRLVLSSIQKNLTALVRARDGDYDPLRRLLDFLAKAGVKP